ncbi:hypothetical protein NM208_g8785 [Fusarium decemcellulare]|uniref:Uncharacterized protein n=1 Tax=Fusarium decemcellulare TaxID=57161 RepID=A0ACC1S408_9HYPO|nr:hypothetical protein NM208_g8785 [Fusarium decemcellulare]
MVVAFHRFGYLPKELRDHIWNLAIRPSCPGVHIYKLENAKNRNKNSFLLAYYSTRYRLAAPSCKTPAIADESGESSDKMPSWRDNNISTYLIDAGLWTACQESRWAMARNFKDVQWPKLPGEYDHLRTGWSGKLNMATLAYVPGGNCWSHFFHAARPHRDLFILQHPSLLVEWEKLDEELVFGSLLGNYNGKLNLAFEYDSKWGVKIEKAKGLFGIIYNIVDAVSFLSSSVDKIWLVDYNLRRKHDAPAEEEGVTFYASDRKFTEVECDWEATSLKDWEYVQEVPGGSKDASSIYFMMELKRAINRRWYSWRFIANNAVQFDDVLTCEVGLLGWDSL